MSEAIEFSVLNRKCGCTRDSSEASCASAAIRRASASSRSFVRSATPRVVEAAAHDLIARDSDADDQRDDE